MNKRNQSAVMPGNKTRIDQVKVRGELAKTRKEQAMTRAELVKTRKEQAKTRAELVKTRTEQTKTRVELRKTRKDQIKIQTKQVEKTLGRVVRKELDLHEKLSAPAIKEHPLDRFIKHKKALERLTIRQREILPLIAESQNTKQVAGILKISSKTVEYHRRKLMAALSIYDIPGLVRFAMHAGVIPPEN